MNTLHIPIIIALLLFSAKSMAQSSNDFRSVSSGNWTTLSVWEVYNGSAWVAASTYPGQVAGTNDVSIEGGFSVTISANIPNLFNSLTVGDGTGGTDQLLVGGTANLNTQQFTVANGGFVSWTVNVTLSLPAGAALVIESGGSLDTSNPCNAAKRIVIGSVIYSSCNGGAGAVYSFKELNLGGGSLSVDPSSNEPICIGEVLNLYANASGLESSGATYSWSATGPGGYSFSSTLADPTVSGLIAGSYFYTVEATGSSLSNSKTIEVTVKNSPGTPVGTGDQTMCDGSTVPTLSATVNSGETVDWYDAATGGLLLLSGNTSYTPSVAGTYYAEARDTASSCVSSSRTAISIVSSPCKVIINRHINSRLQNE